MSEQIDPKVKCKYCHWK